jgi:hypothetical protein
MPHFDTNLPSGYGWGPASKNGEHIVPFTYKGHKFYNGVRAEAAPWFIALLDLVVPKINGGLYQAHATPSVDDGMWGWEYRVSRNSGALSVHSWGLCIDINAVQNPNGVIPPDGGRFVLGSDIQAAVRSMGGLHGRGWKDNMHIECKLDPAELAAWTRAHAGGGAVKPAPSKPAPTTTKAPAFPLAGNQYYGPLDGPAESISGLWSGDSAAAKAGLRAAQTRLNAKGYHLIPDGEYGPATAAATRAFQNAAHLPVDGLIGPRTWGALFK